MNQSVLSNSSFETTFEDRLEEYGMTIDEFNVLKTVVQRPGFPLEKVSKMTKMKSKELLTATNGLISLGLIREDKGKGTVSWIPTPKGRETKRDLTNTGKECLDNSKPELEQKPKTMPKDALYLSNLMEVAGFIKVIRQECSLTPEWLEILVVLKGNGVYMTTAEIASFIDNSAQDVIETKLTKKVSASSRDKKELRWIESKEEHGIVKYGLSSAGEESLELALLDWKIRLGEE